MEHLFELPVLYKGEELLLNGRLVTFGYIYKFFIHVKGQELIFERDDEQQYRVLTSGTVPDKPLDSALIEAIIQTLERLADA